MEDLLIHIPILDKDGQTSAYMSPKISHWFTGNGSDWYPYVCPSLGKGPICRILKTQKGKI
jgi:hypothetical protein